MDQISKINIEGTQYSFGGTGAVASCTSEASDKCKQIVLESGCELIKGMLLCVHFTNGNTYGNLTPVTIYSSDQITYYSDAAMTVVFPLDPAPNITITYTGTGSAYYYTTHVTATVDTYDNIPICDSKGYYTGNGIYEAGEDIIFFFTGEKFLVFSVKVPEIDTSSLLKVDGSNGTDVGVSALINKLTEGSSDPVDNDFYIAQYANGGTTTTSYHRRPVSKLFSYIKSKLSSMLITTTTNGVTLNIGAQNGDWVHLYNTKGSGRVPFIFNSSVCTTGGDLGTSTYQYTNEYLKGILRLKSDSTDSAQVRKSGRPVSWFQGRDVAPLYLDTSSGYHPVLCIKTTNGTWDIAHFNTANWHDKLIFTYFTDTNYAKGNAGNTPTRQILFNSDGTIEGAYIQHVATGSTHTSDTYSIWIT